MGNEMSARKGIKWGEVDWSLTTKEISNLTGTAQGHVRNSRLKYAPETIRKFFDWTQTNWELSNKEISNLTGMTQNYVRCSRIKYAPPPIKHEPLQYPDWLTPPPSIQDK